MNKRNFILIIFLMSISLIGIVAVQIFWIQNSVDIREKQFESEVKSALIEVSETISEQEFKEYYRLINDQLLNKEKVQYSELRRIAYQTYDSINGINYSYAQTILEENYKLPLEFFEEEEDVTYTKIHRKINISSKSEEGIDKNKSSSEVSYVSKERLKRLEEAGFEDAFNDIVKRQPVNKRISNYQMQKYLEDAFSKRGIEALFKYGIYNNDLSTSIKSGYYSKEGGKSYKVDMFVDNKGNSDFQLFVSFPEEKKYILSNITTLLILSSLFIGIIMTTFARALYLLIKQKQISEIKTDFINNMTHEFKTPIATINLALDSMKNPKIINDNEKLSRYIKMIREENKRMHGQVENVLRISKLEKNQLEIEKEDVDMQDIVEDAIAHVDLIIKNKSGKVTTHFGAEQSEILGNSFHLTNVVVNIVDNAIKYSNIEPVIDITTSSTPKNFILRIKDNGIGMSKNVQKNIFDKFYREERGNIHNVKGHGLGLSYVKKIIDNHQGIVFVESEKGKGSTFTIKLPLI